MNLIKILFMTSLFFSFSYSQTIEVRVSGSHDDAEERVSNGDMYRNSSDLELTEDRYVHQIVGIRFRNINIPKNATITNAYIQFEVDDTSSTDTSLTIKGEDTDNSFAFSSRVHDISNRSTVGSVDWNPLAWEREDKQEVTPDLKNIVQKIIDRDGWKSGNAMSFIISGSGKRVAESYDGEYDSAPLLHIEYSGGDLDNEDDSSTNDSSSAMCYALTDNSDRLYKVTMNPNANPLPVASYVSINQTFNGEGSAYRASNNKFYAFTGVSDDIGPSDLYSIDVDTGVTTLIKNSLISGSYGTVEGAEFYFDPSLNREILYVISRENNSKLYAFDPDNNWALLAGYPKDTNTDLSSLAIDPTNGIAYAIDDYNYDHNEPKVYQLNLKTGATTYISTLQHLADAEGLAFASDGNLYIEDEGREDLDDERLYMVNLQTGELTPAAITNSNGDIEGLSCNGTQMAIDNPTLSLDSNRSILEGDSNTTDLVFPITLSKPAVDDIVLHYEITDINTTANEDYILDNDLTILIPKDANSSSIIVKIKGDTKIENHETFSLRLLDATNAIIDNRAVVGTIINDDFPRFNIERTGQNSTPATNQDEQYAKESFYTQIAGRDFDYTIVSYNKNSSRFNEFNVGNMTIKVELIDKNSSIDNKVIYRFYTYLDQNASRFDILDQDIHKLELNATRDARFKISYLEHNSSILQGEFTKDQFESNQSRIKTMYARDNFAIRPASYRIELNDIKEDNSTINYAKNDNNQPQELQLAAGYDYKLKAYAVIEGNNNIATNYKTINSKELNVTLDFDETGTTNCADTNTSEIENYSFFDGKLSKNLSHDNVGKYTLHIEDINWTNVDKNENNLGCIIGSSSNEANETTGMFGCNVASNEGTLNDIKMTFKPYKFEFINTNLSNINGNGKNYTYMSDLTHSQKMGLNLHSTIIAKSKNNTTLTNFTKGCEATAVNLSSEFTVLSDTGEHNSSENFLLFGANKTVIHPQNILRVNDDNSTSLPPFNDLTLPKESFLNENEGNSSIDILYNMQRNFNEASNPIQVNFLSLDANATEAKAMIANKESTPKGEGAIPNSIRTFYFTRIAAEKKNFPKTNRRVVKTPLSVEIYCKVVGNRDWCDNTMNLKNIGRNTHKTDRGWYLAVEHNSTVDGKINSLISSNDSVVFKNANPVADFIDGRVDNIETTYTNDTLEGTNRAEIAIDSDVWLRFNTKETVAGVSGYPSSYSVTFKSISNETGVGKRGYMLKQRPQVDRNGKMSW